MVKSNKSDHQADTRGKGWNGIPKAVVDSEAYRHLSLWGRAVLIEIVQRFNGYNNGKIAISFDELELRLNNSNRRGITRAFCELLSHGLIAITAPADWKHHKAREYRLTFVSSGGPKAHREATNDYIGWTPDPRKKHGDEAALKNPLSGAKAAALSHVDSDDAAPRIVQYLRKSGKIAPNER